MLPTTKITLRVLVLAAICFGAVVTPRGAQESLGTKIKKIFEPTPTPAPSRKHRKGKTTSSPSPTATPKRKKTSRIPSPTPTPETKRKHKRKSPTPTPEETPSPNPTETPSPSRSPHAGTEKKGAPDVTLSPNEIAGYESYLPKVRQILDAGLELTKQNLGYAYGSADPANGGMDC